MILGGGKNMLSSIFSLVEGILSSAGASAEAQNIVSTVFDSILKGIGIFGWLSRMIANGGFLCGQEAAVWFGIL